MQELRNPERDDGNSSVLRERLWPPKNAIVAVIDDDPSIRKSLRRSIQAAGYQAESFASATEFLDGEVTNCAECVVCDVRMPGLNGLQLQEVLAEKLPYLSVIFITGHGDVASSVSAMKAGAIDYLEKPIARSVLLEAIARAVERTQKFRNTAAEVNELRDRYQRLTLRERQVFVLVCAGLLNKQIAAQLGAAMQTVKQHRGCMMRKMNAESLAELVVMAERLEVHATDINLAESERQAAKNRLRFCDTSQSFFSRCSNIKQFNNPPT